MHAPSSFWPATSACDGPDGYETSTRSTENGVLEYLSGEEASGVRARLRAPKNCAPNCAPNRAAAHCENIETIVWRTMYFVRSVPVHSMKTFLVAAEMREWLPLMIGGSESTRSFAS